MKKHYNTNKPFYFSKCDIKDGFWRMVVNHNDAWNFCYVFPSISSEPTTLDNTQLVVPHALQMGWSESPPFFCAATETARDIIQYYMTVQQHLPKHYLEHHLYTANTLSKPNLSSTQNTNSIEV